MTSNIIPEGFEDNVTSKVSNEHDFKNMIIKNFQSNGFDLVKTPLIEYTDNDTSKNVLKISVAKNEKRLNIREDITMQVARLSETRLYKQKRPLKLCYYGEVVRKKGTMLRPERQFQQIGAELIGEDNFLADVEMMELAYQSLKIVGIKKITIEISSRIFFDHFIASIDDHIDKSEIINLIKLKNLNKLLKLLDKKKHQYIIDLFSCTGIFSEKYKNLKKLSINNSTLKEINNLQNIISKFLSRNKDVNIFLDLCEVDERNYHSGVRFTFFAENVRGEIARGGRYFIKNLRKENVAIGFTCFMDSILRSSSTKIIKKKIMVPFNISNNKSLNLIKNGYSLFKYNKEMKITKKMAKDQNCQYYLENNIIKVL